MFVAHRNNDVFALKDLIKAQGTRIITFYSNDVEWTEDF